MRVRADRSGRIFTLVWLPCFVASAGCAAPKASGQSSAISESSIDRKGVPAANRSGGTLPVRMPSRTVDIESESIVAWGSVQVPVRSRLSAAQAMAEAMARAELSRYIHVRVTSFMQDETRSSEQARLVQITETMTRSALPSGASTETGWRTAQGQLTVVAKIRVPLTAFERALAEHVDPALARRVVTELKR